MKAISFFILFSLLSISVASYSSALLTASPPTVTISQIEFVRWLEKDLFLNITFAIDNPNNEAVNIKAVRYKMLIMNRQVAKDYREQEIRLNAKASTQVTIPLKLDMLTLFAAMPEALLTNQLEYLLQGAVVVEGLVLHLPFEKRGVLPLYSQ